MKTTKEMQADMRAGGRIKLKLLPAIISYLFNWGLPDGWPVTPKPVEAPKQENEAL